MIEPPPSSRNLFADQAAHSWLGSFESAREVPSRRTSAIPPSRSTTSREGTPSRQPKFGQYCSKTRYPTGSSGRLTTTGPPRTQFRLTSAPTAVLRSPDNKKVGGNVAPTTL